MVSKVKKGLKQLQRKKAEGIDGLPSWLLKDCKDVIEEQLAHLINMSLQTNTYPSDWKHSKVSALFKAGITSHINNHRSISRRSTELASTFDTDSIRKIDEEMVVWTISGLNQAFKMLSHSKLVSKLSCCGRFLKKNGSHIIYLCEFNLYKTITFYQKLSS
ncbi:uncharacterized protein LOC130629878 [Hydractinia symbiolongicarpus]|uniref:uncharacterized protein LOC130629878 n=1 Tax=Hydractinia symbiolongicarpus TaxID=13093 RepID=UPI00254B291A|nr:uncharacterized protein LOC130629878 [Hydractinia symbiolongicarpus]